MFLGLFAELPKATVSFVMSVRPSAWNSWAPSGRIFLNYDIWGFSPKICGENSGMYKIWQEYRLLNKKINVHLWWYLTEYFLEWEMFQTNVAKKVNKRILCSVFFPPWNRSVYELMWVINVGTGQATDDNVILRMRVACCVSKATNAHWEYVIVIAFPQRCLLVRASVFTSVRI